MSALRAKVEVTVFHILLLEGCHAFNVRFVETDSVLFSALLLLPSCLLFGQRLIAYAVSEICFNCMQDEKFALSHTGPVSHRLPIMSVSDPPSVRDHSIMNCRVWGKSSRWMTTASF